MFFIYRLLINFIYLISPIIFLYRFAINKENINSFKEKIGFFEKIKKKRVIWFHGASIGEVKSIIPILEKFEKIDTIDQILITSNTLSSLKIIKKIKNKKIIHQFFPIDANFVCKKFLDYWNHLKYFL
jgi:3-deoxy-D-manno-octulosonic-acid transferase